MIRVCLDQCAISELARADSEATAIGALRAKLTDAVEKLEVLCPVAPETLVETLGLQPSERRVAIHQLQCDLADARMGGPIWAFKSMWKLFKQETLALARSLPPPSPWEIIQWHSVEQDELAAETWRDVVDAKKRMIERVKSFTFPEERWGASFEKVSAGIILEHASHVYRQVARLLAGEELLDEDEMGLEIARYLRENGATRTELEKLIEDIRYHRWEAIPVIYYRTQLMAQLETDSLSKKSSRAYDVNDEIDVPRLAVGLSAADVIITDAAMAQLCRTVKSHRSSPARVFAIRDAAEVVAHLESVLA
jgi:hypothetical protein